MNEITLFMPELCFLAIALIFFLTSLGRSSAKRDQTLASILACVGVVIAAISLGKEGFLFFQAYRVDLFSQVFKLLIALGFFLVAMFDKDCKGVPAHHTSEYFMFLCISTFGLMLLVSSVELLSIFVALELSSFSLFVIIPFRSESNHTDCRQTEAAIKYVLFGAVSSGIMLFGMSYVFAMTGTTYTAELTAQLPVLIHKPILIVGMVLMLAGFMYKLALFPFHFWTPDVYQGASNITASFVGTMPKLAAVAVLIRLVHMTHGESIPLIKILIFLAAVSMTFGNLCALVQDDLKRLLAYSTIAHAGYVLLGILCVNKVGYGAAVYYICAYLFMNLACFMVIVRLSRNGENVKMDDLNGLHARSPALAITLAAGVLGLAGIPPTAGFAGKFFLFTSAFQQGHVNLVVIAAINTAISIFYYLKMVRAAYTRIPHNDFPVTMEPPDYILCVILVTGIILLGSFPECFLDLAMNAVGKIL